MRVKISNRCSVLVDECDVLTTTREEPLITEGSKISPFLGLPHELRYKIGRNLLLGDAKTTLVPHNVSIERASLFKLYTRLDTTAILAVSEEGGVC